MELQWPLILFTFFMAWSAGTFGVQGLLAFLGKGKETQLPVLITSLVTMVVGGISVFLHLQHWERIFNGFGHITSGITQELIGVVLLGIAIVVFFLMMRRTEDGVAPKWCGIMAMVVAVVFIFIMAHSYNMPALPAWNTPLLEVFYLINAVAMGALTVLALAGYKGESDTKDLLIKTALIAVVLQVLTVIIYAVVLMSSGGTFAQPGYYFDPTIPDVPVVDVNATLASAISGSTAVMFWLGAVAIQCVAAVLMYLARKVEDIKKVGTYALIGLVCTFVGGICWRCILYVTAISMFAIF